jgi:hypothetical protein
MIAPNYIWYPSSGLVTNPWKLQLADKGNLMKAGAFKT